MQIHAISLACWIAALLPAWFAMRRVQQARRLQRWKTTRGKIVRALVEPESAGDGYKVHIRYEFEAAGKKYVSSQTDLGLLFARCINRKYFLTESGGNAYAEKLLAAPEVQVWFDPANPSQSILERSFPVLFIAILIGTSVALLAFGVVFLQ